MKCHFCHQPCIQDECGLWDKELQDCRFILLINKALGEIKGPAAKITRQERKILNHLAKGFSNKQIGDSLGISYWTVRNHVSSILKKLGAKNRLEAVVIAKKSNIITIE